MISKSLALQVLNAGLATGADFAEIYLEEVNSSVLRVENGKTQGTSTDTTYGAGIRLLNGFKSVYGSTNDLSKKGLVDLASTLAASFNERQKVSVNQIKKVRSKTHHLPKRSTKDVSREEKIALLKECSNIMSEVGKEIVRSITSLVEEHKEVTIFNSDGKELSDSRERNRFTMAAVAGNADGMETSFSGPGAQAGFEYFTDVVKVRKLAKETAEKAIKTLKAVDCPSGKMPVVIGNGFGGVIFHESCGHPLEATSVSKGFSIFAGKKGEQIANPVVTAIDDGTIENGWGSGNIDDEGTPCQKNVLIKDGILTSYMVDPFNGRRMDAKSTGSSRRESYRYEPTSRMTNTYIDSGKSTPEEIIASVKLGLYAKSLGGGSVNPATGDFNFAADEAYIIRDGKIAEQVKGATLIGNGSDILKHIDMVANDLERAQGMCGSVSGSIPVDVGQPTIRVNEITVGGNGGELK